MFIRFKVTLLVVIDKLNFRVNEIQRNFKKIQRDIESKKSELRTMVGERYRELINTADTIAEMENTVKDIRTTLDSIQTSCKLGNERLVVLCSL